MRTHKLCNGCGQIKPVSAFHKHVRDGYQTRCKACRDGFYGAPVDYRFQGPGINRPVPRIDGQCLVGPCWWPAIVEKDGPYAGEALLCRRHRRTYRLTPDWPGHCACGVTLGDEVSIEVGECMACRPVLAGASATGCSHAA